MGINYTLAKKFKTALSDTLHIEKNITYDQHIDFYI